MFTGNSRDNRLSRLKNELYFLLILVYFCLYAGYSLVLYIVELYN